ncbi:MAG: bifunctional riboflavin kinase/FAD synthetase [candidate division Zixibacteria bacterium]|nr:bifunctional riboflavin kinase/FAD synthetase [candidate division Zixibacteria bacterium]
MSLEIIKESDIPSQCQRGVVATVGTFDGLHRGHQAILTELKRASKKEQMTALAVTFEPHPRTLVTPETPPLLLTVWEEKLKLFKEYMDGKLLVLEFNCELMNMTAEEFIKIYLVERMHLRQLIVGYDHAFGKNRSGTINSLMKLSHQYSFDLEVVNPVIVEGTPISSSRIRHLVFDQKYPQALDMLGHPYPIYGRVIKGIGLGKKLGFPTANLQINPRKLLPPEGVYSCRLDLGDKIYSGMMFIGINHFNPGTDVSVEVNIFDLDEDLYDREVFCYPEVFIRENRIYKEPDKLIRQIIMDKENVIKIINRGESKNVY